MTKIELGNTGTMVSEMNLGCMLFGTVVNKEQSWNLLDTYAETGGNFLDTSNNYAFWIENGLGGESEKLLGQWMKERNNRKDIILATKVGANPVNREKAMSDFENNIEGLSRKSIFSAVEQSLTNLQTDYIDLYYAHIDDRSVPLEETLGALQELVDSGKVKNIACSNFTSWRLQKALSISESKRWTSFCALQQSFSYLNPRARSDFGVNWYVSDEIDDLLKDRKDISLLAYSPLMAGYYTRPEKRQNYWRKHIYENAGNESRMITLSDMARKYQTDENTIVLAWMRQRKVPVIPLIAATKAEHLLQNIRACDLQLDPTDVETLEMA